MEPAASSVRPTYPALPRNAACLICRRRKIKCHGDKPECNECVNAGRQCEYEDLAYQTRTQKLRERIKELEIKIRLAEQRALSLDSNREPSLNSVSQEPLLGDSSSESSAGSCHTSSPTNPSTISSSAPPYGNHIFVTLESYFPASVNVGELSDKATGSEPSPGLVEKLLSVFISRQSQLGFELHIGRTMARLSSDAREPMIPALLNAMLFMACLFVEDKSWETIFFERTRQALENNIDNAYRCQDEYNVLHHLQAMCILGQYYYVKGRLLEGHVQCSSTTQFAVTLGLHKLDSRIFHHDYTSEDRQRGPNSCLWQPRDSIELGEAINLWWICCIFEYAGSTMNGLPPSIHRDEITTVWPRLLDDFEKADLLPNDNYSIAALLDPQLSSSAADVSGDNIKSLLAKCCVLMEYAGKLDIERIASAQLSEDWWTRFDNCDNAVSQYVHTMPPVQLARNIEELAYLVLVHTVAYCSNVQLHATLAESEIAVSTQGASEDILSDGSLSGLSYTRCIESCRATALAATIIEDIDMSYMLLFTGVAWVCVAVVLTKEVSRLRRAGRIQQASEKEKQLAVIERCMERLATTYPVLSLQVKQLRDLKDW